MTLSLSEVWGRTWGIFKKRWAAFIVLPLAPLLIGGLLMAALFFLIEPGLGFSFAALSIPVIIAGIILFVAGFVTMIYVYPRCLTAVMLIAKDTDLGWKEALRSTKGLVGPYYWLSILASLAILGGLILLIIPGIFLGVCFAFAYQCMVFEGDRGIKALIKSREYVRGNWWRVFGYIFAVIVIAIALDIVIGFIGNEMVATILGNIISLFATPFMLVYMYVMYENIRANKPNIQEIVVTKKKKGYIALAILGLAFPFILLGAVIGFAPQIFGVFQDKGYFVESTESAVVTDEANNLSFIIPAGWSKIPTPPPAIAYTNDHGAVVLYSVPAAEGLSKGGTDITKQLSADEFKTFLLADAPDMKIESVDVVSIDGVPAYRGVSRDESEYEVAYGDSYFFVYNGMEYLIIFATTEGDKVTIEPEFKGIRDSIDLK